MTISSKPGLTRRGLLVSATAGLAFAAQPRQVAPYLALKPQIAPGADPYPEEREAMQIAAFYMDALHTSRLPLHPRAHGASVMPSGYGQIAPDVQAGVFHSAETDLQSGWKQWVSALGQVRRAGFYPLPNDLVRFEVASEHDGKFLYRVGLWKNKWTDGSLIEFSPVEEHVVSVAQPLFRDVTASAFAAAPSFQQQLSKGIPYWRAFLDPASGIDIYGSNGVAVGDIDHDGADEIYVCQPGGLPNRLYKVRTDGTVIDITSEWHAGILDDTSCALFLDLRNTGQQDLVVLRSSGPVLLLNEGQHFRVRTDAFRFEKQPAGAFTGMAAADFDRDGRLDLYLCCYVYFQNEAQYTYASPYHDAQNGPPNFLFRNALQADGLGFLDDCTASTGMNQNNNRFSFAPAWCDYNGDGWPDLYVANDFGRKNLYRNQNGSFRDVARQAGVEDLGPGMSASWFDYDNDGLPDLYVANMWSAAGQRVTQNSNFAPAQTPEGKEAYRRHTKGNSLFRNRGDGLFEDKTFTEHVEFGRWAWSSGGFDFDNDGHAEIFVTCGMLTNTSTQDLMSFFWRDVVSHSPSTAAPSSAYENGWNAINQFIREEYSWSGREPNVLHVRRGDRFFDFSGVSGLDFADDSRAFAVFDFDNDGQPDILLKSRLGPQVRLLQNNAAGSNHSLAFRLQGTKSNRDAIGARVEVDGQVKWLEAGSGFLSQHSKRLMFGLGSVAKAKHVRITWPSGQVQVFSELAAGRTYSIVEDHPETTSAPFDEHRPLPAKPVDSSNSPRLFDTWLLEPVPLPEHHDGPGLLILHQGSAPALPYGTSINLAKASEDQREQYEIFRRYLFDWRTSLDLPIAFLLNADGHVAKVYARPPAQSAYEADLKRLKKEGQPQQLPFEGFYINRPGRSFFKWGAAFLWEGYAEQAMPYLEQVLRQNPENARVLLLAGQIHLQAGRTDEASKYLSSALKVNPAYAEAWSEMGGVYEARNDLAQALAAYEKALSLKPDLLFTLLNAGHAANELNQATASEAWYRKAQRLAPESPEAANGVGLALAKQDRLDEARQCFEHAISLRRDYSGAINNLGVLYLRQGKSSDAIAAFQYGIRMAPEEDILYLNLGRIFVQQQQIDRAREVMRQLLERKPQDVAARRALDELDRR